MTHKLAHAMPAMPRRRTCIWGVSLATFVIMVLPYWCIRGNDQYRSWFRIDRSLALNTCLATEPIRRNVTHINLNPRDPMMRCMRDSYGTQGASACSDITFVSLFIDIGAFPKGAMTNIRKPSHYLNWAEKFRYLENNFVFYTDSQEMFDTMTRMRRNVKSPTKIFMITRDSLWPFKLEGRIDDLFKTPGYPKYPPNTVEPKYPCAVHSKHAVMEQAIQANYFNNNYFAWIDVGIFREYTLNLTFSITLPKNFDPAKVSFKQVTSPNWKLEARDLIYGNRVGVCTCFFLARSDIMLKYVNLYKKSTFALLDMNLMSTDQQVVYWMYTITGRKLMKPDVEVHAYTKGCTNPWFSLAYSSAMFV